MHDFFYNFEELPLIVVGDLAVGLISGTALIEFDDEGVWRIVDVTIDGYREGGRGSVPFQIDPAAYPWLFASIVQCLQSRRFEPHIHDHVTSRLEDMEIRIRSDRDEHSTLNRAQQGV